ncbi:hypothetical protein IscW_ISCW017978, partial [Ixodes scapularis]
VLEGFLRYEVDPGQVYRTTTDNGVNMVQVVTLLPEPGIPATTKSDHSDTKDEDINAPRGSSIGFSRIDQLEGADQCVSDAGPLLQDMRCATHTFQLAVHDAPKSQA